MALYKDDAPLEQTNDSVFDADYAPGEAAAYAGIYGCAVCGREVVAAEGSLLPASDHHEHAAGQGEIRWKLLVNADAEPKSGAPVNRSNDRRCGHPACNCVVAKDRKFCSEYCHDAGKTLELSCNCGHAGCAAELTHRS